LDRILIVYDKPIIADAARIYNLLIINLFLILHKEIQHKGQKGCVLILGAVASHQQEQQYNHQIPGVKVPWQQLF
jgi:hypothetical protein